MRTGWLVVMMVAACGDDAAVPIDTPIPVDAAIDAPACGFTAAPTVPASGTTCNPLTHAGCAANEKCTWIIGPPQSHVGCAPAGNVPDGCACTVGLAGATGYDDCTAGSICILGRCTPTCDPNGVAPQCAVNEACALHDLFGVCKPSCDPLTQIADSALTPACGSADPSAPVRGCYGYQTFTCADAGPLTATDRQLPSGPGLSSCAPGFIPFFFESTFNTTTRCTGYCSALEIDNTPAHAGNSKGNPAALAKLPLSAAPMAGDGTCDIGKKGSHASSTCKFIWPYLVDGLTGMLPSAFANGPLLDTLGVCQATDFFFYDPGGSPNTPIPDCETLPPRSAATTGQYDDAADWNCQKYSNSQLTSGPGPLNPTLFDTRFGFASPVPKLRHHFD